MALLVDAGLLYASIDVDDRHHAASLELLLTHAGPLLVPMLVLTEVAQLVASRLGARAEVLLLGDLAAGTFIVDHVAAGDWLRIADLVWRYRDLGLGTVDASVIAAAERLGLSTVATLDRRHFGVVAPSHVAGFTLLP
jgi:predicted nucleic acid-binding protein